MMKITGALLLSFYFSLSLAAKPAKMAAIPRRILNFEEAKKFAQESLDLYDNQTLYCSCDVVSSLVNTKPCRYKIQKDREQAMLLEWEHAVPVDTFGPSFKEWRSGSPKCKENGKKYKGLKCAQTNPEFAKMESDLYNMFPESAEIRALRSNRKVGLVKSSDADFGGCKIKVSGQSFEPPDDAKGLVARAYLNFDHQYPGRAGLTPQKKKLFKQWDKSFPVSVVECKRWKKFESEMGYKNIFATHCRQDEDGKTIVR